MDVSYDNVVSGKSNGCLGLCRTHPQHRERRLLTSIHAAMKDRCYNENSKHYKYYGGRGIQVEEYLHDLDQFIDWALNNGYVTGLSIDRTDNNKGYSRDNCRWVTRKEQNRNKRNNIYVEWNNETICFTDFVQRYTNLSIMWARTLHKRGVSLKELTERIPEEKGRRAQSIRLGKLRPEESVHGRKFNST